MLKEKSKQFIQFVQGQIDQIRDGGLSLLFKKLCGIPLILLALPLACFVRLIRPWIIVKFVAFPCERIGHFAANTEVYLCERDADMHDSRNFNIFYYNAQICNYQLKKMWNRTLYVFNLVRFAPYSPRLQMIKPDSR